LKDLDHIGLYKHVNVFHFIVNVWAAVWFVNVKTKVAIKLSVIML